MDSRQESPSAPPPPREINCRRAMQQLWDFLDAELTDEQMAAVRHHVDTCSDCLPHKAWAERFLEALHAVRDERLMPPQVKARVMEKLREVGYGGTS
jgi:anti-sigma factor (TIGR02949 family)